MNHIQAGGILCANMLQGKHEQITQETLCLKASVESNKHLLIATNDPDTINQIGDSTLSIYKRLITLEHEQTALIDALHYINDRMVDVMLKIPFPKVPN